MARTKRREGMTIIEAICDGLDLNAPFVSDSFKNDAKNTDQNLKYCFSCKLIWELEFNGGKHRQLSYSHIPKIGKGKCKCPQCRVNDREETYVAWYCGVSTVLPISKFDTGIKKRYVW